MLNVAALIASLAFVALVVALVFVLAQVTRTARAAEQALLGVDRELRPLASQLQALLQEHRDLAQQATRDLREIEGLLAKGHEAVARVANLVGLLGGLGGVGKFLGLAQGLKRGVDVFVHRLGRRR